MINGSFVFGLDSDGPDVFEHTVEWAVTRGLTTATFHILTPYPGTALFRQMEAEGRLLHREWDRYDTRQVVYETRGMSAAQLEEGYWRAYRDFYSWRNIARASSVHDRVGTMLRHFAYAGGWKRFEPLWDVLIKLRRVARMRPLLETLLSTVRPSDTTQNDAAESAGRRRRRRDAA